MHSLSAPHPDQKGNAVKLTLASLAAVTVFLAMGCSGHHAPGTASKAASPPTSASASASASAPASLPTQLISTHPSLGAGNPLFTGFGAVWSASGRGLIRFALTGKAKDVLAKPVKDIALSSHAVVVLLDQTREMDLFNPASLTVSRRWQLAATGVSVTARGDVAYVVQGSGPSRISRIDLSSGAMTTRALPGSDSPAADRSIAVGGGSLWYAAGSRIYQLNPRLLTTERSIRSPITISSVWFGDAAVWASSENPGGGVFHFNPSTRRLITTEHTDAIQIAFSPHTVWLAAAAGATALQPATGALVGAIPTRDVPDDSSAGIAVVGSQVWVDNANHGIVQILHVSAD
jgi:hypothetical protein